MGQTLVCFGLLRPARSRQDESKEVHEVGSKRSSSGCYGVHVLSLYPLIWPSLTPISLPSHSPPAAALGGCVGGRSKHTV
jgi:hypothetical protein